MKQYIWNELIKDIIDALGMSQAQVAEECSVTQQTVSNWMTGARKPSIYAQEKILELAERTGISPGDYVATVSGVDTDVVNKETISQLRACLRGLGEEQRLLALRVLATLTDNLRKL